MIMRIGQTFLCLAMCAAAAGQDLREAGKSLERRIGPGETHEYAIDLAAGQFISYEIDQAPGLVRAFLLSPSGAAVAEGGRRIITIAEQAGGYRLQVRASRPATYVVRIEALRTAIPADRTRLAASARFSAADQLRLQNSVDSRRRALAEYEAALALWREAADATGERLTLNALSLTAAMLGEPKRALESARLALPLHRAAHDRRAEVFALVRIGQASLALEDARSASDALTACLALARELKDADLESSTLNNLGVAHWLLGENREAIELLEAALELRQKLGDKTGLAYTRQALGSVWWSMGEAQKSLDANRAALALWRELKQPGGEADTLNSIGLLYASLDQPEEAIAHYNQALPIWKAIADHAGLARTLNNLGLAYSARERPRATSFFEQALDQEKQAGFRRGEAYTIQNLGDLCALNGRHTQALDYFARSLSIKRELGDRWGETETLHSIGESDQALGDPARARMHFEQALTLRRAVADRAGEALTLAAIARLDRDSGQLAPAREHIEAALDLIESGRVKLASPGLRLTYFSSKNSFYEFYIDVLTRLGEHALALEASERARARVLLDGLAEARADIRAGADPELLGRERALSDKLNAQTERMSRLYAGPHADAEAAEARRGLDATLAEYQENQARIRQSSPRYAALVEPRPATLAQVRALLDDDSALIEYSLGAERSYAWAVTRAGLASAALPSRATLERLALRAYQALTARNQRVAEETPAARQARLLHADAEWMRASRELSARLLAPFAAQLGAHRILIVADGALGYIPFAALPAPGSAPLIAHHEVVWLPSASALAALRDDPRRATPSKLLAVLADPVFSAQDTRVSKSMRASLADPHQPRESEERMSGPLPRLRFSRLEAEQILSLAPMRTNLAAFDFDADRALVERPDFADYRFIHLATHAIVDTLHPELSGIALSGVAPDGSPRDGFLRMYDIYNLRLRADLVVLSACRTALGKQIRGEGLVGLSRAFFYAGAPRVVASQWSVEDRATAELMRRFYSGMWKQRLAPAAALRAAQNSLRLDPRWSAPYHWAAFALYGEWK
jgi:CHAT domain-containing protein/tetratricopeptide (TPR) repeat protein